MPLPEANPAAIRVVTIGPGPGGLRHAPFDHQISFAGQEERQPEPVDPRRINCDHDGVPTGTPPGAGRVWLGAEEDNPLPVGAARGEAPLQGARLPDGERDDVVEDRGLGRVGGHDPGGDLLEPHVRHGVALSGPDLPSPAHFPTLEPTRCLGSPPVDHQGIQRVRVRTLLANPREGEDVIIVRPSARVGPDAGGVRPVPEQGLNGAG